MKLAQNVGRYFFLYSHQSTMGHGSKKYLSPSKSWDTFQNDQNKLQFTLDVAMDIAVSVRVVTVKLVKICPN